MDDVMKLIAILQTGFLISTTIFCATRSTEQYVRLEHDLSDKEKSSRSGSRSRSKSSSRKSFRKKRVKPLKDEDELLRISKRAVSPDVRKTIRMKGRRSSVRGELKGFVIGSDRSVRRLEDHSEYTPGPPSRRERVSEDYCTDLPSVRRSPTQKSNFSTKRNPNRSSNDTHHNERRPKPQRRKSPSKKSELSSNTQKKKKSFFGKLKFKKKSKKSSRESILEPEDYT